MSRITIRPLGLADIDAAATIFRRAMLTVACFDEHLHSAEEDRAHWREQLFPNGEIIGAFADQALVGQIALAPGWINQLHVDPDWHGRGIGSAMLDTVKAQRPDLQLWTFQANLGARRFYERHGFMAVEFTDGEGNEEKLPDVRYRWLR
jgi:putative acetyltransferase